MDKKKDEGRVFVIPLKMEDREPRDIAYDAVMQVDTLFSELFPKYRSAGRKSDDGETG